MPWFSPSFNPPLISFPVENLPVCSHYVLWVLWKSVNRQHVSSRDKQKSKCQGLIGTLTSPSACPDQAEWEVLDKRAARLTGSKGEPGPANCRSCAFGRHFGSLFFSVCFAVIYLSFLSCIHPTQILLLWSIRAWSSAATGTWERSVWGHKATSTFQAVPWHPHPCTCIHCMLCVCTDQNIYSSPLSYCSPHLWKYQTCSKMGEIKKKTPSVVFQPWGTWAIKCNCFGVRFYLAPWNWAFW